MRDRSVSTVGTRPTVTCEEVEPRQATGMKTYYSQDLSERLLLGAGHRRMPTKKKTPGRLSLGGQSG